MEDDFMEMFAMDPYECIDDDLDFIDPYECIDDDLDFIDPYECIDDDLDFEMPFSIGGQRRGNGGKRGQNDNTSRRNRGDDSRNKRQTQKFGHGKDIKVPSHKVGRIIGKGGWKIHDLEHESKAKIKIGDSSRNETTITLFGSTEAVLKVEGMISKLLEDRRPVPWKHFNNSPTSGCF